MSQFIALVRAWLTAIGPELPPAALIVAVFLAIYSVRRWLPRVWLFLEHALPFVDTVDPSPGLKTLLKFWQALPAAALAAVTGALLGGTSVRIAVWGVVTAGLTAGSHELLADYSRFFGQVGGPVGPATTRKLRNIPPLAAAGLFAICLTLGGCGLLSSPGSIWPTVAKCAPSPQNVINSVTQVLLGGGDAYQTQLEQLGEQYGTNIVVCVVDELVKQWGSPTAKFSADTLDAKSRGQAFLASVGTKVER